MKKKVIKRLNSLTKLFYLVYSIVKEVKQTNVKVIKFANAKVKKKQL